MFIFSCQNDESFENKNSTPQNTEQELIKNPDKIIKLGKKLENPYAVSVMKKAFNNLKQKESDIFSKSTNSIKIETTDYYVRFLPKSDEEKEILQEKDSLTLFDMPLDYELEEGVAGAYQDPSISEGNITWQYTVVPVNYKFRDIQYQILANLFLQDDDFDEGENEDTLKAKKSLKKQISQDLWTKLENEALTITGNEEDIIDNSSTLFAKRRKWKPSGRIQYEDNTTTTPRIIPLQGAKIIVKRWFKWKSAITNANGEFRVGKFRSKKVKCAIKWERKDWDIRSGSYGQAWYSFETLKKGNNWDKTIRRNSTPRNWLYASIHRGAMEYFYNHNAYGIRKPYNKNSFLRRRLHIGAKHKSGRAHYFTFNKIWWSAPVVIYSSHKNNRALNSRDLFATTIHELAHVSHWEIGYSTGQFVIDALADDPFLPESWATGVEHTVINRVYPNTGQYQFPYILNLQHQTLTDIQSDSEGYTPIVIDMIDNDNQSRSSINNTIDSNRPNDRVSGYTLGQLEDALPGSLGSWWSWRTRIRQMYNNRTENAELDYLFRQYR